jgi:predicted nucleic acid-binding Zn ribbon protein
VLVRRTLRIYHHKCIMCGEAFTSDSPMSRTCSAKHRVALSRWRKKLPALGEKVIGGEKQLIGLVQEIGQYLYFPDAREEAIRVLCEISNQINTELEDCNIKRVK